MEQLRNAKGFICDMDGVIYHGNKILPGVKEFVEWLYRENKQFLFLTNNSGKTPKELQEKLARMGLDVDEHHFYTSALATAEFISRQSPGAHAFVIGEPGLYNALYEKGITLDDTNPDYVVIGESPNYNYDNICKAVQLVQKGAPDWYQLRFDRTDRAGNHACLPRLCQTHRAGHRQGSLLHRQAQPADDAHRTEYARGTLERGGDDW